MAVLKNYWPENNRVEECILTEAESLSSSLLMAVHEPMRLIKRQHKTGEEQRADEQALFDFFLKHNRPIPITGAAGVGKSHIIRWLGAQLNRQPDADKYRIIYIPKSSSITDVVRLLIDDLDGDVYNDIRQAISGISQEINVQHVSEHLALKLRLCLDEELVKVAKMIDDHGGDFTPEEEKWIDNFYDHGDGLKALLQDSHLTKHFTREGACLYNIAERLIQGVKDDQGFEQDYQMKPEDFEIRDHLAPAAQEVQEYIRDKMLLTESEARKGAAWTLNQVLYIACGKTVEEVLKINPMTIQQVVRSIRQQLYAENEHNELVILIEDFTTTTAIQKEFIECLMEEEKHHTRAPLCRLKSVIAVTEGFAGYLHVRDGILGRTGYEWFIESASQNESETMQRIVDFCGRYLNAARYGEVELERIFDQAGNEQHWLPVWHDGEITESSHRPRLDAFGYSGYGHSLFPYNRFALEQLARKHCVADGQLQFHPRSILHYLLRDPLQQERKAYLTNMFPPARWQGIVGNTAVNTQFNILSQPERAKTVAAIWGGNPTTIKELSSILPIEVCEEFNLSDMSQVLDSTVVTPPSSSPRVDPVSDKPDGLTIRTKRSTEIHKDDNEALSEPDELVEWREVFDAWYQGFGLKQDKAAQLRKWIAEGLNASIDWVQYACRPEKILPTKIHLPAKTGNTGKPVLDLNSDALLKDKGEKWIPAFNAMAAYHYFNKSWQFDGGDIAYLYYQNFFDDVSSQVTKHLVDRERKQLASVSHKLLQGANLIGAEGANAREGVKRLEAMLLVNENQREYKLLGDLDKEWGLVTRRRLELRDELIRLTAVKKPSADPYAIEGKMIIGALSEPKIDEPDVINTVLKKLPNLRKQVLPTTELLRELFDGDKGSIEATGEVIQEILALATRADVVRPAETAMKLRDGLKVWSKENRVKLIKHLSGLQLPEATENEARLLQEIVSVDAEQFEMTKQLFADFETFDKKTSAFLMTKITNEGGDEIEQAQQDVFAQLDQIEQQLEELN
ncbi:protein DpdH [Vibrio fortis]|uniref:protein DpdH n=1 Tax=Vibrio fortis TaxID=212667 RepID=UPI002F3E7E70